MKRYASRRLIFDFAIAVPLAAVASASDLQTRAYLRLPKVDPAWPLSLNCMHTSMAGVTAFTWVTLRQPRRAWGQANI